ncbi:MAG: sulfurtransferase TusA family protein [Thermaerobacter sp.]|nr:sulfurtransferase TusA family protein [Thermaerobacter sp.]
MTEGLKVIDARNSFCPGPLMELIKEIRQEQVGAVMEVWSSDAGSAKDIPEWIRRAGHELLASVAEDGIFKIRVKKLR